MINLQEVNLNTCHHSSISHGQRQKAVKVAVISIGGINGGVTLRIDVGSVVTVDGARYVVTYAEYPERYTLGQKIYPKEMRILKLRDDDDTG